MPRHRLAAAGLSATILVLALVAAVQPCLADEEDKERPELLLQTGVGGPPTNLQYTPDGKYLLVGPKLLDAATHRVLRELPTGGQIAFTADGRLLVCPVSGGVGFVDLSTGRTVRTVKLSIPGSWIIGLALSPDGKLLAVGLCGSEQGPFDEPPEYCAILLFDATTGELRATLRGHRGGVHRLFFTPDGSKLISASRDGTLGVWDVATGRQLRSLPRDPEKGMRHLETWAVDLSRDGRRVVATIPPPRSRTKVWDVDTGEVLAELGVYGRAVSFGPDSRFIALGGWSDVVTVLNWETREMAARFPLPLDGEAWQVAFSPSGHRVAAGLEDGSVLAWDLHIQQGPAASLECHAHAAMLAAFTADPDTLLVGYNDERLVQWDCRTGRITKTLLGAQQLGGCMFAATPAGDRIAVDAGNSIEVWDTATGARLCSVPRGRAGYMDRVALSPDGKHVAWNCWHAGAGLADVGANRLVRMLPGDPDYHTVVAFSPDSKLVATVDRFDIKLWSAETGELRQTLTGHTSNPYCLAFSPDGRQLASAVDNGTVYAWDTATGRSLASLPLPHLGTALSYSADGRRLNVASPRTGGRVYDTQTWRVLEDLPGAPDAAWVGPWSVAISSDCSRLACPTAAGGVALYDWRRHRLLANLIRISTGPGHRLDWLAVTPEGYYDGTVEAAGYVTWRVGTDVFPVEAFRDAFFRPDLVARALRGESLDNERLLGMGDLPPRVKIVLPEPLSEAAQGRAAVQVVAYGLREVQSLEIYANGRRAGVELERGIATAARGIQMEARGIQMEARDVGPAYRSAKAFVGSVPLPPGEQRVTLRVVAVDAGGLRSRPAEVTVLQRDAALVRGVLHVLCVGISKYAKSAYDLSFADGDAQAVADALKRQSGPDRLYSDVHCVSLLNSSATAAAVRQELARLVEKAGAADTVLVFLAGHGVRDEGFRYYLATYEADLARLDRTALPWSEFQGLVRSLRAKQVLVVLDTCHAAGALGDYSAGNQALGEMLADRAGVMVLASSSATERSYESQEWGHGAFTMALLEALSGKAGKRLSPGVLEDYLGARVAALTEDRQHPYVPIRTQFPAGVTLLLAD